MAGILIDYSNYIDTQTEWAKRLLQEAKRAEDGKPLELGTAASATLHRVSKLSRDRIEVI